MHKYFLAVHKQQVKQLMMNARNHMEMQLTGLCLMNLYQMEQKYKNSNILNHILSACMSILAVYCACVFV